ncbi:MAG TPA: pyridoxamine 5'-phosphate oxidase family protein [Ramlibacter sp.]|nr:pyridoxamine 5'-phosphate oxidase family protein [Ramlibacter sp.]
MPHLPRLTRELRALLDARRVGALGTIGDDGAPLVSMVPFAVERQLGCLVVHVSDLAAHTRNLRARPRVSLLVTQADAAGESVLALPRASFDGRAGMLEPGSPAWRSCRAAYLARFPEAQPMTEFADFHLVAIEVTGARQVAGFGSARSLDAREVRLALVDAREPPG